MAMKHEASWSPDNQIPLKVWSPPRDSMTGFMEQFPSSDNTNNNSLELSLNSMQTEIAAIRKKLETKPRKVTLCTIDDKLNLIIKILNENGLKIV